MNIDIEKLLEKYYAGETSLEEEKLLRNSLISKHTNKQYLSEEKMFELFAQEKQERDIFSAKQFSQTISPTKRKVFFSKKFLYFAGSIAACLIVAMGIIHYQNEQKNMAYIIINGKRINDRELATTHINDALQKTSTSINDKLKYLERIEKTEKKLEEIKKRTTNIIEY